LGDKGDVRGSGLIQAILKSIYAPSCAACDTLLPDGQGLCAGCRDSCEVIDIACPTCAQPIAGPVPIACARCRLRRPVLDSCTAPYEYGGQIAVALKKLKFQKRSDLARTLQPLLCTAFARAAILTDVAVPVPLHRRRLSTRGFNQAQRLLLPLARHCQLPVARGALRRIRDTAPQAQLNAKERAGNLRAAFEASEAVTGKRVLLLDDIRTTGSTLDAAARALRRAGATEIHAFVVARADWGGSC
jgi:ComF family protein